MKKQLSGFTASLALIFFSISLLVLSHAFAKDITVAFTNDIPPFIMKNATEGLEVDIIQAALEHKGHSIQKTIQCPYKRLERIVARKEADAAASVRQKNDDTFYSDNFIAFENYAITQKKSKIVLGSIADLKGKTIFTWQNAHRDLGPEFAALFAPTVAEPYIKNYHEIAVQEGQVRMFWRDPLAVIIIDKSIFIWFTKKYAPKALSGDEIVYNELFPIPTEFQVNFQSETIRDDFNEGLKYIRENGIYQAIFDKYLK